MSWASSSIPVYSNRSASGYISTWSIGAIMNFGACSLSGFICSGIVFIPSL